MKVSEVMNSKPLTLKKEELIIDVVKKFRKKKISGAPVVSDEGHLVGLLTNKEIMEFMEVHEFGKEFTLLAPPFDFIQAVLDYRAELSEVAQEFEKLKTDNVGSVMNKKPVTISPDTHVSEAADLMVGGTTHLPVLEDKKLLGLVTRSDLLKSLV
jgi:CBS domain-containing protein